MFATLLLAAITLQPGSALRVVNPHGAAVEARLVCVDSTRTLQLAPRAVVDLAESDVCEGLTLDAPRPLLALETSDANGVETQQEVASEDDRCGVLPLSVPQFICRGGSATVSVPPIGVSYSWSVEGASITGGSGTSRISLQVGDVQSVKITALVNVDGCTHTATGVMAVREPILIKEFNVPSSVDVRQPVTITWSYDAGAQPASQLLTSDAFEAPVVLTADQRSYTYTPETGGTQHVELRASYAPSIKLPVSGGGRRRAVGSTLIAATCPSARSSAAVNVRGCLVQRPVVQAPDAVEPGATFTARAISDSVDDTFEWTAENATILSSATSSSIELRAATTGPVRLSVRMQRGADCFVTATARVAIENLCAIRPTANITNVSHDCNRAKVKATFTGTPPFTGAWSDGTTFRTFESSLTHEFTKTGYYTINNLRDANCSGIVNSSASLASFRASVKLSTRGGACTNGKLVATFTGAPPFSGRWSDGEVFTTSEFQLEKTPTADGIWSVELWDSACSHSDRSNELQIAPPPTLILAAGPACQFYPLVPATVVPHFNWGAGPYTVEWSDGVKTVTNQSHLLGRDLQVAPAQQRSVTVVRANNGSCDAVIPNKTVSAVYRPAVALDTWKISPLTCVGKTGSAALRDAIPPGATIVWTISGGAEITGGQGTSVVTWRALKSGDFSVKATANYADGTCETYDHASIAFRDDPVITDFRVEPAKIKAGGTATVKFSRGAAGFGINTMPVARQGELSQVDCKGDLCTATFKDTKGAGTIEFELQYSGECTFGPYHTAHATLTIEP